MTNKRNEESVKERLMARVDLQSMEKIERLGKSGNEGDQIKALTIFENTYPKLPIKRARDFIDEMKKSENEEVKQQAGEVYEKTVKVYLEKLSESLRSFTEVYRNSFQILIPRLNEISNSFLISKQFAKLLNESLEMPIKSISKSLTAEYIKPLKTISETVGKQLTTMRYGSPILETISYAAPLIEKRDSEATLGQILKRDPDDIRSDLEKVIDTEEDVIFN